MALVAGPVDPLQLGEGPDDVAVPAGERHLALAAVGRQAVVGLAQRLARPVREVGADLPAGVGHEHGHGRRRENVRPEPRREGPRSRVVLEEFGDDAVVAPLVCVRGHAPSQHLGGVLVDSDHGAAVPVAASGQSRPQHVVLEHHGGGHEPAAVRRDAGEPRLRTGRTVDLAADPRRPGGHRHSHGDRQPFDLRQARQHPLGADGDVAPQARPAASPDVGGGEVRHQFTAASTASTWPRGAGMPVAAKRSSHASRSVAGSALA